MNVYQMVEGFSQAALLVDHKHLVLTCNPALNKLLPELTRNAEFKLQALLHESPLALPLPYTANDDIDAVFANGKTIERQVSFKHSSGSTCQQRIQYFASRVAQEKVLGVLIVFTDITHAQEQERRVYEANEELTQLQHHLSHDLSAPITSIGGLLQMITGDFEDGEFDEIPELLQESESQIVRLKGLISDLMSLAQSGVNEPTITTFDVRELVQDISDLLSGHSRTLELSITVDCSVDTLTSDRVRVKQILTNLISNARKFQNPDEVAPEIVVLLKENEQGTELIVQDNGIGICESRKDSLFDLFVRGDAAGQPGHGLGLYIVRKHVAKLGGSVEISRCSKPTEFTICLPHTTSSL
ncbi:PAS domain-containing sensor histidine kinase [Granulosicoccus antarcticus]|uniref:PAS domain-containing sensor histidine kinase n=1 Tax=Granulosicoccus antarcticus TaxID=437505 RepID=UPI00146FB762|nr:HAMP domain-containing sensor histidine kinase [Granulosicoccus antarcticus]